MDKNLDELYGHAKRRPASRQANGAVYGMGVIGSLVYYLSHAHSFGAVVFAVVKGIFWPSFLVFDALVRLHG